MREVGHVAGGYLVTRQLVKQWQLSEAEKNRLLACGSSNGSDRDSPASGCDWKRYWPDVGLAF